MQNNKLSLEEINILVSKLSLKEIENLSDDEILDISMPRPGHPEALGFMLQPPYFKSTEHFSEAMHALGIRLGKVSAQKIEENKLLRLAVKPTQCNLWNSDISSGVATSMFENIKDYSESFDTDADHRARSLLKCNDCVQLYFHEWIEYIDYENGNDPTYSTYIPVANILDADKLNAYSSIMLCGAQPRIQYDWPADEEASIAKWVRDKKEAGHHVDKGP